MNIKELSKQLREARFLLDGNALVVVKNAEGNLVPLECVAIRLIDRYAEYDFGDIDGDKTPMYYVAVIEVMA